MIFKIAKKKKLEGEEVVTLYLEYRGDRIVLEAANDGFTQTIMEFNSEGTFCRAGCVSDSLGFRLDSQGRIVER